MHLILAPSPRAVKRKRPVFLLTNATRSPTIHKPAVLGVTKVMPMEMHHLPAELEAAFERRLDRDHVPPTHHADYQKWITLYLRFCQKSGYHPSIPTALGPFLAALSSQGYSIDQRHHAGAAVKLLLRPDPQDPTLYLQISSLSLNTPPPSTGQPSAHAVPDC